MYRVLIFWDCVCIDIQDTQYTIHDVFVYRVPNSVKGVSPIFVSHNGVGVGWLLKLGALSDLYSKKLKATNGAN